MAILEHGGWNEAAGLGSSGERALTARQAKDEVSTGNTPLTGSG